MITLLVDHDIEGHAIRLWDTLVAEGWLELFPIQMVMFADIGLAINSNDRQVWRFAQAHQMLLVTNNRNMKGENSLTRTLREENSFSSWPVVTIGKIERLSEKEYREQCVSRLVEILLDLDNYLGTARIFIP